MQKRLSRDADPREARGYFRLVSNSGDSPGQAGTPSSRRTCRTSLSASGSTWDSPTVTTAMVWPTALKTSRNSRPPGRAGRDGLPQSWPRRPAATCAPGYSARSVPGMDAERRLASTRQAPKPRNPTWAGRIQDRPGTVGADVRRLSVYFELRSEPPYVGSYRILHQPCHVTATNPRTPFSSAARVHRPRAASSRFHFAASAGLPVAS